MFPLIHRKQIEFHEDVALMRVGNAQSHLLINANYDRILLINLMGRTVREIPFPESIEGFLIYTWLVAPDGRSSYLFSSDPLDFALALDHERVAASKFMLPASFPAITELCWVSPDLHMLDYNGNIWVLQENAVVPARPEIYEQEPSKTYRSLIQQFTIVKPDYHTDGLFIMDKEQKTIGYMSLTSGKQILTPQNGTAIGIAQYQEHLFVCFEHSVIQFYKGTSQIILQSEEDQYFLGIDVVYHQERAYIAVLAATLDENIRPRGFLDIYALGSQQ